MLRRKALLKGSKSKGSVKLASAIRKSILPVASGLVIINPFFSVDVFALPQNGIVQAGQATITQSSNQTVIHQQSNRAAIQWNSFNINSNESVNFIQPSSSSAVLNRIIDQNPSQILGKLTSNGQVFLINPNGIVFGKTATVNVAGIVASSLDITTKDFMAGKYIFTKNINSKSASIINKGLIKAATGGVTLIGSNVINEGKIYAKLGNVNLISANKVSVDFDGDGLIQFEVDKELIEQDKLLKKTVSNTGEIIAEGGHVILNAQTSKDVFSQVVNNDGVIKASRIEQRGGDVFLIGGSDSDIVNTGTIDVSGFNSDEIAGNIVLQGNNVESKGSLITDTQSDTAGTITIAAIDEVEIEGLVSAQGLGQSSKGGKVVITGDEVEIESNTLIDASGQQGGGEILIGGDYQGKGDVKTAKKTEIDKNVIIKADAITAGDGGKVIIWADEKTEFEGDISAKGGKQSGDGGFVEVSGKKKLKFEGNVDTTAENGQIGMLLLDPEFISVVAAIPEHESGDDDDNEGVDHPSIYDDVSDWLDNKLDYDEAEDLSIILTKAQLEGIASDITLQATIGIEFDTLTLNLSNNLTLETRNNDASEGGKLVGQIHGIDTSKASIIITSGSLVINSGTNASGENDNTTAVILGEISSSDSITISSSNSIKLMGNLSATNDITLNSGTDNANGGSVEISLSKSTDVIVGNEYIVALSSSAGDVIVNGDVNGQSLNELLISATALPASGKGNVSLEQVSAVNALTINSETLGLNGDVTTIRDIDLSSVNLTTLKSDVTLTAGSAGSGDQILLGADIDNDISNVDTKALTLNADNVELQDAGQNNALDALTVTASQLTISGDVSTQKDVDLSGVTTATIKSDVSITAGTTGSGNKILLGADIDNDVNSVDATALTLKADSIDINNVGQNSTLESLNVTAATLSLNGDINTSDNIDLTNVTATTITTDVTLTAGSVGSGDQILLGTAIDNDATNANRKGLTLSADTIALNDVGQNDALETLNITSSAVDIDGDITTQSSLGFTSSGSVNISGGAVRNVISNNGDIDFTGTPLSGNDLSLQANGLVSLDAVTLNSLKVQSVQATNLNNNILTTGDLDLSGANSVILLGALKLESQSGQLLLNSVVNSSAFNLDLKADTINLGSVNAYDLSVDGDSISLDSADVNNLNFTRTNSTITLKGDITTQDNLQFGINNSLILSNNSKLILNANGVSGDAGQQILANSISGNFDLVLDVNGGQIDLYAVNTNSLDVTNSGTTTLNSNITTAVDMDLSAADTLALNDNLTLTSDTGNIDLSQGLNSANEQLVLAANSIDLGASTLESLNVTAATLSLNGDINTSDNIDLTNVTATTITTDVTLTAGSAGSGDQILLGAAIDNDAANANRKEMTLSADTIALNDVGQNDALDTLNITSSAVDIDGDITTQSSLDFTSSGSVNISGGAVRNVISNNGDIDFTGTPLSGNDLSLQANGLVSLDAVTLNSLTVQSVQATNLNNNILTTGDLDLSGANSVILLGALKLESQSGQLLLNSVVNSSAFNLDLKADTINLGSVNAYDLSVDGDSISLDSADVNNLNFTRTNSTITLKGDITTQDNLQFGINNSLILSNNSKLILNANGVSGDAGQQILANSISGNFDLVLDVNGGQIDLYAVNTNSLDVTNSGTTTLNSNITTAVDMDLSAADTLALNDNLTLTSDTGNIDLSQGLNSANEQLVLAANSIDLGASTLESLNVTAATLSLNGDINTSDNIDLTNVTATTITTDVTLTAGSAGSGDQILLGAAIDNDAANANRKEMTLSADTIALNDVGQNDALDTLNITSSAVDIDGDITTQSSLDFTSSGSVNISGGAVRNVISNNGDIDFTGTPLSGNDLSLQANGLVSLDAVTLNSLKVQSVQATNLNNNILTTGDLDLSGANSVILLGALKLESQSGQLLLNSVVNSSAFNLDLKADTINLGSVNAYDLSVDGDSISLDSADVNNLNFTRTNSTITLKGDITTQDNLQFGINNSLILSNNSKLILNANGVSGDAGQQILANSISGNFDLVLDVNGGQIDLYAVNTNSLDVTNSGTTTLNSNITTAVDMDLSAADTLALNDNLTLTSDTGNIDLSQGLNSANEQLVLAANSIDLGASTLESLNVTAAILSLNGDINTSDNIDLTNVTATTITTDVTLTAGSVGSGDQILLGTAIDNDATNANRKELTLSADTIALNDVGQNDALDTLNITSSAVDIDGDITTQSSLDFSLVTNATISGNSTRKIESNTGNIDFSLTDLSGNDLALNADQGDVSLAKVNLQSLSVQANNANLYNTIVTSNSLDLSNAATVVLYNSLSLDANNVLLDTQITGQAYDLTLDADVISLGQLDVKSLSVTRAGTTSLNGDITTQADVTFATNTILNLAIDSTISSLGNQVLASAITGAYDLTLQSQGGQINLNKVNTKSLTLINSGITNLNDDISTQNNIDLNSLSQLTLNTDISFTSTSGNIDLSQGLDNQSQNLTLNAGDTVILGESSLNNLIVNANELDISGNLSTQGDIDLSRVSATTITADVSLSAGANSQILLGQNLDDDISTVNANSLTLNAETINLQAIGQNEVLDTLSLNANTVNINGNVTTQSSLDFTSVSNTTISGINTRTIESNTGNIDFSSTELSGNNLALKALQGDVSLSKVNLQSLSVQAQNANLYNTIVTSNSLDLSNAATVVLYNSLSLDATNLLLDTQLTGQAYDLILDADIISLGASNLKSLNISRAGTTSLNGDITTQADVIFTTNTVLDLVTDSTISSLGNQVLASSITGENDLTLQVNSGEIDLYQVATNSLTLKNASITKLNDDITTQANIDLSGVTNTVLNTDVSLLSKGANNSVLLGQNTDDSNSNNSNLKITADTINLQALGQDKALKNLELTANSVIVDGDITTNNSLSFTDVRNANVSGANIRTIESNVGDIDFANTRLTGNNLTLIASKGDVSLNAVNLQSLTVEALNARLYDDITTINTLDLNNANTVILYKNIELQSKQSSLLLNTTTTGKAFELSLNADNITLGNTNVNLLSIVKEGSNFNLNGNITSQDSVFYADNVNLNLTGDSIITSKDTQVLADTVSGDYDLILNGQGNDIEVNNVSTNSLSISNTDKVTLKGDITTIGDIDLSEVVLTVIDNTIKLISTGSNNTISLGGNVEDSLVNTNALSLTANKIELKNIGQNNSSLKQLNLNADTVNIAGNIMVQDSLSFNQVKLATIKGDREIQSTQGGIDFSPTLVSGEQLTLRAEQGDVRLGAVQLQSLTVFAKNTRLYDDIETNYLLDLNNASTIVLHNSLSLKSQLSNLLLDTVVEGQSYDLSLDAASIYLGNTKVNTLSITKENSSIQLNGNVSADKSLSFAKNTTLNLSKDTQLKSNGAISLAGVVNGNVSLLVSSNDVSTLFRTVF
ncbi:filamentous hemagglutinin N-terminal domain-containing protein [sulfur-oxidizing endosymbiont of Gigantopelta aegis]|uniref:two-partner secretion domain-containing protein n=1 Tax=sulfur-oxidizing endosymbiont of Gigantopelta aegis TaxID=2794934 RepID=UPI0018DEAE65|nr:filamentous hemagglutinin N-terminal domain-containing protein [sulfur-oxidizing endosymbiont of Gigantopelta aegis]